MTTMTDNLLDPSFMARLDQLSLVTRKIFAGRMRGERLTKRRGQSVEFADFRSYVSGDDLRHLAWNIFARLEKLFIKLFLEEEDLHVSILVDASKSMNWGEPNKSLYARQLAAAIAYIGLINFDRVSLYSYADGLTGELAGVRGRRFMVKVIDFLTNLDATGEGNRADTNRVRGDDRQDARSPLARETRSGGRGNSRGDRGSSGESNLALAGKQFAVRHPQPGIVLVLSDFFEKGGYEEGLRYLLGRRYDVYAAQILSPEEVDPVLAGDLKLTDVEDADVAEVTVGRALINRYKQNLQAYCAGLKDYCTRRGVNYLFTTTTVPFDQIVLSYFRQRGLIQ